MSKLVGFYRGKRATDEGFWLDEILNWSDAELEAVHTYIQWLFPLPERSGANPNAPVLEAEDVAAFRGDDALRAKLRQSWLRMLAFYGLEARIDSARGGDLKVERAANFGARARDWLTPFNHNHLRITRLLRSMHMLGLEAEARATQRSVLELAEAFSFSVSAATVRYWRSAF